MCEIEFNKREMFLNKEREKQGFSSQFVLFV